VFLSPARWRSKQDIGQDYLNRFVIKRQISEKTKVVFLVDGFPRQGNISLRTIILYVFPEVAIPEPLTHNIYLMKEAINESHITLCPIRNPYEAISSTINQEKRQTGGTSFRRTIKEYITMMTFILENKDSVLIIKYEDVLKMCLDFENHDTEKNTIIRHLQDKFGLSMNLHDHTGDIVLNNTSHRSSATEKKLHSFWYKRKMGEVVKLYSHAHRYSFESESGYA